MLISVISAFIFLNLFAFLPGKIITKLTKLPDWLDLQLTLGLTILPLVLFFGRYLLPVTYLLAIYLFTTLYLYKKLSIKIKLPSLDKRIFFVIILGVVSLSLPYLKTFSLDQITTAIASNHDQAWHLSLINELIKNFPPQTPGFSGQVLKSYHYFYDLIISANTFVFKANPSILLQFFYPVLFSTLFGTSVFRIITYITKNKTYQILGILLAFFGNNLSFVTSNFFLLDQPLMFIFNHQTVLSIAIVLYFLIILNLQLKKPILKRGVLLGLLLAGLSYLKVYALLVVGLVLVVLSIKHFKKLAPTLITAGTLVSLIILLTFEPTKPMLIFKPLWLVTAFTDKIIVPLFPQLFARAHRFYYKPLVVSLILFSNYHLRLLGLFIKKRSTLVNLVILTTLSSLGLLFFTFQTQSPYNIIQFAPYATIGFGILLISFTKQLKPKIGYTFLTLTLLLSLPSTLKTAISHANSKSDLPPLQLEMIEVINHLKVEPSGLTLSLVDRDYHRIPDPHRPLNYIGNNLVSSIGNQPAYFADQKQLEVLNVDYQSRLDQINQLKQNFCQDKTLLKQEEIQYLIIADDLAHCAGDDHITFTKIHQTEHFSLFKLD